VTREVLRTTPKQERGEFTVDAIRQAAVDVYNERGRDRFTMQAVANTAHVSIGTVYRYFKDRVALLDAIHPDREDVKL